MKIDIRVNETAPWLPGDLDNGRIKGSEEMVVLFARAMSKRGHAVRVFCSLSTEHVDDSGISYTHRDRQEASGEVLICFKCPKDLDLGNYEKRYLWTADKTRLSPKQWESCDGLVGISPWHFEELMKYNPSNRMKVSFIEPGFDPMETMFDRGTASRLCVYLSSHDRGLDHLLEVWPEIKRAVPDAWLLVTYDSPKNLGTKPNGVEFTGCLSEQDHVDLMAMADVWLYPCDGQERYCIAGIKAQHYGAVPCVIPHMALRDTVQFGIKTDKDNFASEAINLLHDDDLRCKIRTKMQKDLYYRTWNEIAQYWEKLIG